jgi:hypothetical protein
MNQQPFLRGPAKYSHPAFSKVTIPSVPTNLNSRTLSDALSHVRKESSQETRELLEEGGTEDNYN